MFVYANALLPKFQTSVCIKYASVILDLPGNVSEEKVHLVVVVAVLLEIDRIMSQSVV